MPFDPFISWASYQPKKVPAGRWAEMRGVVFDAIENARPGGPALARRYRSALVAIADWTMTQGHPAAIDVILHPDNITRFGLVLQNAARSTAGDYVALLRRLGRANLPHLHPTPVAVASKRSIAAPYTATEIARYVTAAAAQPTPTKRTATTLLLTLGLGAGLDAKDLRDLYRPAISRHPDGTLLVHVTGSRKPRVVPVLDRHADQLQAALAGVPDDQLLVGGKDPHRKNPVRYATTLKGAEDLPPLNVGRLRSTWIATHLAAATPIKALCDAAGVTYPSFWAPLIDDLPPIGEHTYRQTLRSAA